MTISTLEDFKTKIVSLYQNQYKYYAIIDNEFEGIEQRKINTLENIRKALNKDIEDISLIFMIVFEKWLSEHAILNSEQWAHNRIKMTYKYDTNSKLRTLDLCVCDYLQYCKKQIIMRNNDIINALCDICSLAKKNKDKFPSFANIDDMLLKKNRSKFAEINDVYNIELDICRELIFNGWFEFWSKKGLTLTRKNVENAFEKLKMIKIQNNIGESIATINIALNMSHVEGKMMKYVVEHFNREYDDKEITQYYNLLSDMSKGIYLPKWNEELKEIGVKIR